MDRHIFPFILLTVELFYIKSKRDINGLILTKKIKGSPNGIHLPDMLLFNLSEEEARDQE